MNNRHYRYLIKNNFMFDKKLGFTEGHSTIITITELVVRISDSFSQKIYSSWVFIDLLKAFDTAFFREN